VVIPHVIHSNPCVTWNEYNCAGVGQLHLVSKCHFARPTLDENKFIGMGMTMHRNLVARGHVFGHNIHLFGTAVLWIDLHSECYAGSRPKLAMFSVVCIQDQWSWLSSRPPPVS